MVVIGMVKRHKNMKIVFFKKLSIERKKRLFIRSKTLNDYLLSKKVNAIISDVKKQGDKAVRKYVNKYNKVKLNSFLVTEREIKDAYGLVDKDLIDGLKQMKKAIEKISKNQIDRLASMQPMESLPGIKIGWTWKPIQKVGLYIPGGKAVYPSTVLMTCIPAVMAKCKEIIVCTPPNQEGKISPSILVACDMIGIKKIYKVGGAEAIASMANGTETIPKVYKIFGPGNIFVNEAKRQVFGETCIDLPAGPSEVFIIADETANPAFVAADLLCDCEHDENASGVLLTNSEKVAKKVIEEIKNQLIGIPTCKRIEKSLKNNGIIGVVNSIDEAIEYCNAYAPEHLEIMTKNSREVAEKIENAGTILVGPWTTKSAADYATGANHVLPTNGMAKMFGSLSILDYGKFTSIQEIESQNALKGIAKTIKTLSKVESLPAHTNSLTIRFDSFKIKT